MKKIIVLAMLMAAVTGLISCKKDQATTVNIEGLINFMAGDVKIVDGGTVSAAKIGDTVKQGMTVKTGPRAVADIYFGDNVIRILENSSVVMTELVRNVADNRENSEFYVENGKMFSRVTRKLVDGEKFRVNTPTSVAGVRGTEFIVSEEEGKSNIACIDGVVVVKEQGSDDSTYKEVEAGKEANVEKGKPISVADLKEQNRANIKKIKDDIKAIREDIRRKFEEQRDEIRQAVIDEKAKNKQAVEDQKAKDQANIQAIKDDIKGQQDEIKADVSAKKDEQMDAVKNFEKTDTKSVKPEIKKFDSTLDK
ncbi:MAG: hypothetical protein GXY14_12430 [Spirochaetes bacterium]|nr:hypothetical protein [Spirochaetota bacterium]